MLMASQSLLRQFSGDERAVREEPRRLQYRPKLGAAAANAREHPKPAHMSLDLLDIRVRLKSHHTAHLPARGNPRVLVQEVAPVLPLILLDLGAKLHMPRCLA